MHKPFSLIVAVALLLSLALPSLAQQTITVSAVGQATVKPDTLVITGEFSDANEKMKDAVTGFRDTRRRALAAINELGIENMTVSTSALSMKIAGAPQGGGFGGGAPQAAAAGALVISQTVTLTVSGIDTMEQPQLIDLVTKLMAGAKEAGVKSDQAMNPQAMMMMQMGMGGGSSGAAMFCVSDPSQAQKAATKDAVEKARADAAYLAELAGGKLGKVVRISDSPAASGDDESSMNPYMMIFGAMMGGASDENAQATMEDITITRPLTVTFELITD